MKTINWNAALREHLMKNYKYDRDTGEVTRRLELKSTTKGPWQHGPLGSVTKAGDLMLNINFEGKQYGIRIHRLAVFLETGFVYEKVIHRDEIRTNNKWENLITRGRPLAEDGSEVALTEEERMKSIEEFNSKKRIAIENAIMEKEVKELEREKSIKECLKKQGVEQPLKAEEEKYDWEELNRAKQMEWREIGLAKQNLEFSKELVKIKDKFNNAFGLLRFKRGVCTGMHIDTALKFLDDCERYSGVSNQEFFEANSGKDLTSEEKWVQDRYKMLELESKPRKPHLLGGDGRWAPLWLSTYRFNGEEVVFNYEESPAWLEENYQHDLKAIENAFGYSEEFVNKLFDEKPLKEALETLSNLDKVHRGKNVLIA